MTSLVARGLAIPGRLHPADLDVEAGELVALVGPNGGGKTSLLRALARIETASGAVAIGGEDVDPASPRPAPSAAVLPSRLARRRLADFRSRRNPAGARTVPIPTASLN